MTVLTIQPSTKDGDIWKPHPDTNYPNVLQAGGGPDSTTHSYIEMDFSTLPDNANISSSILSLFYYGYTIANPAGRTTKVFRLTQIAISEALTTWNKYDGVNNWNTPGGDYTSVNEASCVIPADVGDWMSWDVTEQVKYALANTNKKAYFLIKDALEDIDKGPAFRPRTYSNSSLRPKLVITYTLTSMSPSASPSMSKSASPSASPSNSPSLSPSKSMSPSASPSASKSMSPSNSPSLSPSASMSPSISPSESPSLSPSMSKSSSPSISPSMSPSASPSAQQSYSMSPSESPSLSPSASISPSESPSLSPSASESPSASPSESPSESGSVSPSESPSASPSISPYKTPVPSFYTSLLTSQYQNSPKLLTWLEETLEPLVDASNEADILGERFNLDSVNTNRFGADWTDLRMNQQLDIIGEIVGAYRVVDFEPSGGISPTLDNKTFLLLIRAKIANNHWNGSIDSLQPLWKQIFPDGSIIVVDNQDMTVDIYLTGAFTSIIIDLIQNDYIVPRPQGVLINYHFGTFPFLGFDLQNNYIAGFDTGYWT